MECSGLDFHKKPPDGSHRLVEAGAVGGAHRSWDVLDRLIAGILEDEVELPFDLIKGRARDADSTRLREAFESGSYVHAVADDSIAFDENVAQIDADPEEQPASFGQLGVAAFHLLLDLDGAAHGIHHAGKLGQHVVTWGVYHPATTLANQVADQVTAGREGPGRPLLVLGHEPAVADGIGGEDGGELALGALEHAA